MNETRGVGVHIEKMQELKRVAPVAAASPLEAQENGGRTNGSEKILG